MDPAAAVEFLWSGQDGYFELARTADGREHRSLYPKAEALSSLAGNDRFGPLPRVDKDERSVEHGNVLWVDIDDADRIDVQLARIPVAPSLVLHSGNTGFWVFWKLAQPISTERIEFLNRRLADRLDADRGSWRRSQLARLPGAYRSETGKFAEVIHFGGAEYEPDRFAFLNRRRVRDVLRRFG